MGLNQPYIDAVCAYSEIQEKADWDLKKLQEEYRDLYEQCRDSNDRTHAKGCLDSLTRMLGGFSDKLITEHTEPQLRELNENQKAAARLAAKVHMHRIIDPDGVIPMEGTPEYAELCAQVRGQMCTGDQTNSHWVKLKTPPGELKPLNPQWVGPCSWERSPRNVEQNPNEKLVSI